MELEATKADSGTSQATSGITALKALSFHFSSGAGSQELGSGAAGTQGLSLQKEEKE